MKEWKGRNYSFEFTDPSKPVRTFRTRRPCHFIFEIDNYKQLVESMEIANLKYFETPDFTVGDEKWSMCIYPNGNKERQGSDYVSLYLKRLKSAGRSKEANASMKFFILEQNSDEYLVIEDLGEKHFDVRGRKWGIAQAIALDDFTDKDNGFLVDNTCTFGAEVFITSAEPSYSKMSLVNSISKNVFEIGIKFDIESDYYDSTTFTATLDGNTYTWKLRLYLTGHSEGTDSHVSLYLILVDINKLSNGRSMLVNFQLSLKNKSTGSYSYSMPAALDWYHTKKDSSGYSKFIEREAFFNSTTKYDYLQTANVKVQFKSVFILNDVDE
ncbi:uncharacterized protein LOC110706883 [Chenopodium quinoa]|uniref:uncharacterized protein LOC110706883 n=1 Tax=Chenopodium quinoa TaxID=63459 RepID=UPI000B778E4F|nr:uncharacterized protein LOC110706883 [Chenopodium quinoa]